MNYTLTTPLFYVNDKPHLGSAYTTVACDAMAIFHRLMGDNVIFITGVDEHGQKIERTANMNGIEPKDHCEAISKKYIDLWNKYEISYDSFVRTSSSSHIQLVEEFYERVKKSGDIYLGRQQGWYCVGCEEYKDNNNKDKAYFCDTHQRECEWRDEENLFFKLSKYQKQIEDLCNKPNFINPKSRQREIVNFVSNGLKDFSISRIDIDWGIPVPDYPGHTFYVWFDALLGYLSAITQYKDTKLDNLLEDGWPADVHFIGKDILRFHAIYWPAMLISAGLDIPKKVFGHGFLTREGQKMGKSLGNVLDPVDLSNNYSNDAVRWYLLKDFQFGNDGDFQEKRFVEIINNDLANTIGNLLNRTSSMSRKWFKDSVPKINRKKIESHYLKEKSKQATLAFKEHMNNIEIKQACESVLSLAIATNTYLNDKAPWKLIKEQSNLEEVSSDIFCVLETIRIIGLLLIPIVPKLSSEILTQLNYNINKADWIKQLEWGNLKSGSKLPEPNPIITRLEYEQP